MNQSSAHVVAEAFAEVHEYLIDSRDSGGALRRLVELAVRVLPGCDAAAVTVWPLRASPHSLVTTDDRADAVDALQYECGEGPCLQAALDSELVHIADLGTDERWPTFAKAAREQTPIRSVIGVHLVDHPVRSALNLYGDEPRAFGADDVSLAALFAAHARVLQAHAATTDVTVQLNDALATSRQIGAALGILMITHKITLDEAVARLKRTSQDLQLKLRRVAELIVETGEVPDFR